jgi:hypothetical protein
MSEEVAFQAAILAQGGEKLDRGGVRKAATAMLAKAKLKPDNGFRKSIDDAIAVVEAEWKAQREREQAEKHRLERARQKGLMVLELMILPQLNDLCADFAADDEKVLPNWQVQTGGDADTVFGMIVTPPVHDGGPSCFTIRAAASVAEKGGTLNLTVECSCVDAQNLSTGKVRQIFERTKAATMAKFDDLGNAAMVKFDDLASEMWFHRQLEECTRMCVLTRMRHTPRNAEEISLQAALGV